VLFNATEETKKFQEKLGLVGGEAQRLADTMRKTFEGIRKELVSTIESLKIEAFGEFGEEFISVMKSMIDIIRENKAEIILFLGAIVKTVKDVTGAFVNLYNAVSWVIQGIKDGANDVLGIWETIFEDAHSITNIWRDLASSVFSFGPSTETVKAFESWNKVVKDIDTRQLEEATQRWDKFIEGFDITKVSGIGTALLGVGYNIHRAKTTIVDSFEELKKSLSDLPRPVTDKMPFMPSPDPIELETRVGDYQEILDDFRDHQILSAKIGTAAITTQYDLLGEWMESWAGRISMGMQNALEHTFFDWMQGRIEGIRGLFQSLANDVFNMMSRMAAQKAAASVMESIGLGIPTFQHGGIVTQPTLALIGEQGPEAVVPLSGRQDESLLSRIASRMGGGSQGDRPMTVNVNISTPNPQTFRESKSQVAAQMAVALTAAGRNL
jgi:hypothetical protein